MYSKLVGPKVYFCSYLIFHEIDLRRHSNLQIKRAHLHITIPHPLKLSGDLMFSSKDFMLTNCALIHTPTDRQTDGWTNINLEGQTHARADGWATQMHDASVHLRALC